MRQNRPLGPFMKSLVLLKLMCILGRKLGTRKQNGHGWEVNQLLFAEDTVLVAVTEEKLQQLVK